MEGYREGVNEAGGEFLDAETQYANATADLAVTAMEGIMSKYPEGVAIICSNNDDMALAAARTAKDNPNYAKTIFLGFDGQKSAVEAVLNGELTMTAAQNNFDIGYKAVETREDPEQRGVRRRRHRHRDHHQGQRTGSSG